MTSDQEKIDRVKTGDQRAFAALYNDNYGRVYNSIRKEIRVMSGHTMNNYVIPEAHALISDLAAEVFAKAYEAIMNGKYDNKQRYFKTWLHRVAKFHLIDWFRANKKYAYQKLYRVDGSVEHEYKESYSDYGVHGLHRDVCPVVHLERKEARTRIMAAFDKVNPRYKKIGMMRFIDDLEYSEIAKKLKKSMGTVKAELFRVRKDLMADLETEFAALSY